MDLEASKSQARRLLPGNIKGNKKCFKFWIKQGKTFEEAKKLSITPFQCLKQLPDIKRLPAKKKIVKRVYQPTYTSDCTQQEQQSRSQPPASDLACAIRVGICAEKLIGHNDAELVMREVGRLIDTCPDDVQPRFVRSSFQAGIVLVTCADRETRDWLKSQVTLLKPWKGAQLRLVEGIEIPKPRIGVAWIKDDDLDTKTLLHRLHRQNRALGCSYWKVLNVKKQKKGRIVTFSFNETSFNALRENNFQVFLTTEMIELRVKNHRPDVEGSKVSTNSSEAYEPDPLLSTSKQNRRYSQPQNYRSPTLDDEDVDFLMDSSYGGPSAASGSYSMNNLNEEETEMTDWSSASSQMLDEDNRQHDFPDAPHNTSIYGFIGDQTRGWPSSTASSKTHWYSEKPTQNSWQYSSVSPHDTHNAYNTDLRKDSYREMSAALNMRVPECSTSTNRPSQDTWHHRYSSNPHDARRSCEQDERWTGSSELYNMDMNNDFSNSSYGNPRDAGISREQEEEWTRSSTSNNMNMRKDISPPEIVWEPMSYFSSSSVPRASSPSIMCRAYSSINSRARSIRETNFSDHSLENISKRGRNKGSKRERSSYQPYQQRRY